MSLALLSRTKVGVRVARLPAAEWAALGDAESRLMHVHNLVLLLSSD